MSNEIQSSCGLQILSATTGGLQYRSVKQQNQEDLVSATPNGPTPGSINVPIGAGVIIDLSELTTPGVIHIDNLDDENYVTLGVWTGSAFLPVMDIDPGKAYTWRLARNLGTEYGAGTGTVTGSYSLKLVANTAACKVFVGAFER